MYADGKEVQFEAYNINGSNYFKLRDVAYAMNGTSKQFDVRWNSGISILSMTSKGSSKGIVEVIPNQVYTVVGGELKSGDGRTKKGSKMYSPVFVGENSARMAGYNIDGNNFLRLRDIGKLFNFMWDGITTVLLSIPAANIMVNLFCGAHLFVKQKISSEMKNLAAFLLYAE